VVTLKRVKEIPPRKNTPWKNVIAEMRVKPLGHKFSFEAPADYPGKWIAQALRVVAKRENVSLRVSARGTAVYLERIA
jgi:hypothetical protein